MAHFDTDPVLVLTTWASSTAVEALAHALVADRLAACVSILPSMRSIYRWEGKVEDAAERQLIIKTTRDRVEALRDRLGELHPYEVPEFLVLPVADAGAAYSAWLRAATRPPD